MESPRAKKSYLDNTNLDSLVAVYNCKPGPVLAEMRLRAWVQVERKGYFAITKGLDKLELVDISQISTEDIE